MTARHTLERVRELHRPQWYRWHHSYDKPEQAWLVCRGCDEGAHAEGPASWPCSTAALVYSETEIASREPQIAECTIFEHRRPYNGELFQPGAMFVVKDDVLYAIRWQCDHVEPVLVTPPDPWTPDCRG